MTQKMQTADVVRARFFATHRRTFGVHAIPLNAHDEMEIAGIRFFVAMDAFCQLPESTNLGFSVAISNPKFATLSEIEDTLRAKLSPGWDLRIAAHEPFVLVEAFVKRTV